MRAVRVFVPVFVCLWLLPQSQLISSSPASTRQAATTASKLESYTETIPGTNVAFEMVAVPGGTFQMGSPAGERERDSDEGPVHAVILRPFWIGKFEVTWDEYDRYAFATDAVPPAPGGAAPAGADAVTRPTPPYGDESFGFGKERNPAINMTHHGAMEYTWWLSSVTGKSYRLPTEAEWEYAARAGSTDAYSFGADARALDEYAWYEKNSGDQPHPVGQKKPNAWGIHDVHGNVAEWCLDQYAEDFYTRASKGGAAGALVALLPGPARFPHVVRGGSWADDAKDLRSAARRGSTERWSRRDPQSPRSIWWHTDGTIVGFRVARAADEYPELRGFRSRMTRNSPDR